MKSLIKMACCAALVSFSPSVVDAAVFTYTFYGQGTGSVGSIVDGQLVYSIADRAVVSFAVDITPGSDLYAGRVDNRPFYVSANANGIAFSDPQTSTSYVSFNGSGRACFANTSSTLPTATVAIDPECSSLSFRKSSPNGVGGFFSGTITSFTVSEGGVLDRGVEAVTIAAVPEPASWALMLAGFAMTGYALRRRRATVAFA